MWNRIESGACAALLLIVCSLDARSLQDNGQRERLQRAVASAIEGRNGAVIVADVASGDIVAAEGMKMAAQRLERPGSAVKPFVLKALLESGKIDAGQKLMCRRPLRIGGTKMDCAHTASVVELNAEEALAYSCNSYFAEAVLRLSGAELAQALRKAGLDSPSGLNKEEAVGHIALPASRETLQLEALGERGIEVTALELLEAYRKLALEKRTGVGALDAPVFAGLEQSVSYGMAHGAFVDGMTVAGKTGTAASRRSAATHGFFAGYGSAEKPEIVIVVFVEQGHGGDAAAIAQPVFAEFARSRRLP